MDYNELMQSFAASLGVEGVQIEGGAAAFEIDGMKVNIFHDDAADTVMIYGEIGHPRRDRRLHTGVAPAVTLPRRIMV